MQPVWMPALGQVALIEFGDGDGVVLEADAERLRVDVGAGHGEPRTSDEVVASFFTPEALYRVRATVGRDDDREATVDLTVREVERVQRRTSPRVRVALPAVMSDFDGPGRLISVRGETVDIGAGGCRVRTLRPFPPGSDPTVSIRLPEGEPVVTLAAILQALQDDGYWDYRLVFMGIEDDDARRLDDLAILLSPA
jgi:hypothetical protein